MKLRIEAEISGIAPDDLPKLRATLAQGVAAELAHLRIDVENALDVATVRAGLDNEAYVRVDGESIAAEIVE